MKANPYPSPITLPERKLGRFEVKYHYQKEQEIVGVREAMLTGKPIQSITFDEPQRVTGLYEDGLLWIADIPAEIKQHQEAFQAMIPRGRVLVGGLGLGIMASLLADDPRVEHVDVIEIAPEVAKLCDPQDPKVTVIVSDLRTFLESQPAWKWDCAFIDIWRGTNESTWWEEVFPIRRTIGRNFGSYANIGIQYWAEDIMLGQVGTRLVTVTEPHWHYKAGLKLPMTKQRARWFIYEAGSRRWERRYGHLYPYTQEDENGTE